MSTSTSSRPTPARAADTHPIDEILPLGQMVAYGLQHVLSMYAGVVAVPLIVGSALKLSPTDITFIVSAGLFISGLATLLQTVGVWKLGARQPLIQGTSFAAVSTMIAIGTHAGGVAGMREIFGSLLVAGAVTFLLAPVFTTLLHFFPEVVTGTVITIIGVSLFPVAIRWSAGGAGTPNYGAPKNIALAAITMLIIVLIYRFLPGYFGRIAILLGLVLGSFVAIPFGLQSMGKLGDAKIFQVPVPFHFGLPTFAIGSIISMIVVMLVIMTETTADILAVGEVCGKPADRQTVTNGLRADTLSTSVSSILNGFSISAFAQNVGLVAITGIKSRFVVAVGGLILILLGLFPKLGALVALVPLPVLGGAGLALFGSVAAAGIRTLGKIDWQGNANLVIVSFALGLGIIPIAVPDFYEGFPRWFTVIFDSGITATAITAVFLNIVFNVIGRKKGEEGPIFSEAPPPGAISEKDEAMLNPGGPVAHGEHSPGNP